MSEAATIAARLSKAEREAVWRAITGSRSIAASLRGKGISARQEAGVNGYHLHLTPIGLEVRAILERTDRDT